MLKQSDLEKIERYINGQSDDNEKAWVDTLFLTGEDNFKLMHLLETEWNQIVNNSLTSEINLNHLLDKIHHEINRKMALKRRQPLQKFIRIYMRAAAILLLPLLIAGGLIYNYLGNQNKPITDQQVSAMIYSPTGTRVSFNLPDGTRGMLNSGSSISYSLPFSNNRHIKLDGEAYFDVTRDENHPFEITAGTSSVKVLGTRFNMSCYSNEQYVELVLDEGKIEYLNQELSGKITMSPSEKLVFQNGQINRSITDPAKYSAWTQGKLVFRGDNMVEVARRIERWYNVSVELSDKELEKYSFRATFEDNKLEDVLRFLCMTSPIKYQITESKMMPDGTFVKEKVTISPKY